MTFSGLFKPKSIFVFIFSLVLFPVTALANINIEGGLRTPELGIAPLNLESEGLIHTELAFEAPPAATIEDSVVIANLMDFPISVLLDAVDAKETETQGKVLENAWGPKEKIGSWISFKSEKLLSLRPHEKRVIPIVIKIPEDAIDGLYDGAVTLEETNPSTALRNPPKEKMSVLVKVRLALRTFVKVKQGSLTKRLLFNTVPRTRSPSFVKQFLQLPFWQRMAISLASFYIVGLLIWETFEFLKRHPKIKPKLPRAFLPMRWFVIIALILTSSFWFVTNATSVSFSISPPPGNENLRFEANPGDTVKGYVNIYNSSAIDAFAKIYSTDGFQTAVGAIIPAGGPHEENNTISKWTMVDEPEIFLKVGERKKVTFRIKIPEEVTPGDYPGAILVEEAQKKTESTDGMGIVTRSRSAVMLHLTVRGEKIADYVASGLQVETTEEGLVASLYIENTGNVLLKVPVEFSLMNAKGELIDKKLDGTGEMLPRKGMDWKFTLPWNPKELKSGTFILQAKVGEEGKKKIELKELFAIKISNFPWLWVAGGAAVLFIMIIGIVFFLLRKKQQMS